MAKTPSRYEQRGVSPTKSEVHKAVARLDKGVFPGAFCKLVADDLTGDESHCLAMHADTAGTKTALAYLVWKETGDPKALRGVVQDAVVMNTDDLMCVGVTDNILISSTIARNSRRVSGEALAALIEGFEQVVEMFGKAGVRLVLTGGETADVGDLIKTFDVGVTATVRIRRDRVIDNDNIRPGHVIVGFSSSGQASYETEYNSGIGSNGLTSARHDVLAKTYAEKYPETYDEGTPSNLVYSGAYRVEDTIPEMPAPIGNALLSPTRTYLPVVRELLSRLEGKIYGMIHCTGGGQTKCRNFGRGIHYVKDGLFRPPPIFRIIQQCSGSDWGEMYQVFNMGHRLELYLDPVAADEAIRIGADFGIVAQVVGRCEAALGEGNDVTLQTPEGTFRY